MTTGVLCDVDVALKVVSDASGRMRVHVNGFDVDAVRAVAIEETVAKVPGVHAVQAYPRTASVVIRYSPQQCDTAAVLSAIAEAEHIPAELVPPRAPHSADIPRIGVVRRIASGIGLALLGLHRRVDDRTPDIESCGSCHSGPITASELSPAEQSRDRRSTIRRVKAAGFPRQKWLSDFDFDANPNINPATIHQLATGDWISKGQPLCLIGDSGTGKSHLLIALGTAAA